MLFFTLNGSWLSLYIRESLAEDATVSPEGSGFNDFTLSHNVASESEVDQIIEHSVSVGAILVKTPQKVFWGGLFWLLQRSRWLPMGGCS